MSDVVLRMSDITKSYKNKAVVDSFGLEVRKGHICGLIGPNGAGKTTIMKLMAGLTAADKGEIELFGSAENLNESRARMSFMLEAPIIDTGMTAYENMMYIRYVRGVSDEKRIGELLEFVGLGDTDKKPVKHFSLGMKQRLGIAMSLMTSPEIMVADEPVNGLDPEGIVDVRNIFLKLSQEQGVTVIISSHLLAELSELCTDYTIINHGKTVESLSTEELSLKCKDHICVKTNDTGKTTAVLEEKLGIHEYKVLHGEEIHINERVNELELISKTITDSGLILTKLSSEGESLEEYYLSKVGEQ